MGEFIYWKKFDAPKMKPSFLSDELVEVNGEWICNHPLVDRAWLTIAFHPSAVNNDELLYSCHVILKTYERKQFNSGKIPIGEPYDIEILILQAEQYLKSLK